MHRLLAAAALLLAAGGCLAASDTVVLIGGKKSEGAARHEYPEGVRILEKLLRDSPDVKRLGLKVAAFPEGWPDDPAALRDAATMVWYFDGFEAHPLRDAKRARAFEALARRGTGIVSLHQASTVSNLENLTDGMPAYLGGARFGFPDRLTDIVPLAIADRRHPVARGLEDFSYYDEFFPSMTFPDPGRITPILRGPGFPVPARDPGFIAGWTFTRPGGGRAFVYTGAHYLAALDQPQARRMILNAIVWTARREVPRNGVRSTDPDAAMRIVRPMLEAIPRPAMQEASTPDTLTFHRDARRTGWHSSAGIARGALTGGTFALAWESPQLDGAGGQPPRLYASPLYMDRVGITAGAHRGKVLPVVFAATSSADVYAIAAGGVAPGTILWKTRLGEACRLKPAPLDGVPTGVLSTPVIDSLRRRLYVTSCDEKHRWQAFALDIGSGALLPGWPITLSEQVLNEVNANAGPVPVPPTRRHDFRVQRGALNLSRLGQVLHATFGETETGWIAAIDTTTPRTWTAFAAAAMPHRGSGGMWGAGGAAVDERNQRVFVATGTGYDGYKDQPNDWTQSVLVLGFFEGRYALQGTYTPFNHCITAKNDIDLGSGGVMLLPDRDWASSATPLLAAVGGKQGNVYLLDRARLGGRGNRRPPCSTDAASDASLLPPQPQPQFGTRGPLNVFGPYSEQDAAMDLARARSVPAYFEDAQGRGFLFVTGTSKRAAGSAESVPPSLARLAVVAEPGERAYLRVDAALPDIVLLNPGSPVVTSEGYGEAIVWVLDENAPRSALLSGPQAPRPVLHAFDAMSLRPLWRSPPGILHTSGKYNTPLFARGMVIVGTDRIQAFAAGGRAAPSAAVETRASAAAPGAPRAPQPAQANYAERCSGCHDHPQGSIPPRSVLARRSELHVLEVLSRGAMRPYTLGLSEAEIEALARYVRLP